jgi:hypothetical protein
MTLASRSSSMVPSTETGKFAREEDVDGDGAVLDGRIDAGDLALDDAVAGVDDGELADLDVLGLGFGDANLGLEPRGIGDAREVAAGLDLGADLDGKKLEDAVHAGAHREGVEFVAPQPGLGAEAIDLGLLDGELGLGGFLGEGVALLLDGMPGLGLLGGDLGEATFQIGYKSFLEELLVHLGPKLRLLVFGAGAGGDGLGLEHAALERDAQVEQFGLGGLLLRVGVGRGLLDVGIGEMEDDAVRRDEGAGAQNDLVDAAGRAGGDPANFLGHQGAEAADLANHLALLDRVDPHRVELNGGGGGLEPGQGNGDADERATGERAVNDALLAAGLRLIGTLDIHERADLCTVHAREGNDVLTNCS